MVVGSLFRHAPDRGQVLVLIAVAVALLIALVVVAVATVDGTWATNVGVDDGRLTGPFRWFPIDPAEG